jgi:hypothetical protein
MLIHAWEHLSPGTVEKAWDIFQDPGPVDAVNDEGDKMLRFVHHEQTERTADDAFRC